MTSRRTRNSRRSNRRSRATANNPAPGSRVRLPRRTRNTPAWFGLARGQLEVQHRSRSIDVSKPYRKQFRVYPLSYFMNSNPSMEESDKIYLPQSAFEEVSLRHVNLPMTFEIRNPVNEKKTHSGVIEFTAEEYKAYLPKWMMDNLGFQIESIADITSVNLRKGKFVVLQAHKTAFTTLPDPKGALTNTLQRFTCLTQGDTITVRYGSSCYKLDVHETRPDPKITVVDTDIKVDFLPPKDYQEKEKEEESRKQALSKTTATKSDLEGEGGGEEKQGGSQQVWGSKKHEKGGATRASGSSKYFERLAEQGKSSGYSLGGGSSKRPLDVTRSSKKRRRDSGWGNS
mmetsp:Transcript_21133/g.34695  ORF Transcript_21133/g.34695 Transcript_21133/m.34695 type:complete len:343 (-) Transcript_21133:43-1071(-)